MRVQEPLKGKTGMSDLSERQGFIAALGLFMACAVLAVDITVPALPVIADALGQPIASGQYILTVTLAGYALAQIPMGILADRYGRRPVILGSLAVFIVGGAIATFAHSLETLLSARFFQGLGAAGGPVLARAVIRDVVEGPRLAHMMSTMSAYITGTNLAAPLLGGLLLAIANWRWVMAAAVVHGALALVLMVRYVPETGRFSDKSRHPARQLLDSLRLFWASPVSVWTTVLTGISFAGYFTFLAQGASVAADVYGVEPTTYAYLFALAAVTSVTGAMINRRAVLVWGAARMLKLASGALGLIGICLFAMSFVPAPPLFVVGPLIMLYCGCNGMVLPNATALALDPLPRTAGLSASILGTVQVAAGAIISTVAVRYYDGTAQNLLLIMGVSGVIVVTIAITRSGLLKNR